MNTKSKKFVRLSQAILSLRTEKEAARFLRDLMTEGELREFSNRLRAAEMLAEKIPYKEIEVETGLSSTTVARVAKWLNGNEGGYRLIIGRLHHDTPRSRRGLS